MHTSPDEEPGVAATVRQARSPMAMMQATNAVLIDFPIVIPFFCGLR